MATTNTRAPWKCEALVPNGRTNKREVCNTENDVNATRCGRCGAPRSNTHSSDKHSSKTDRKGQIIMSAQSTVKPTTTTTANKPAATPTKPTAPAATTSTTPAATTSTASAATTSSGSKQKDPANKRIKLSTTKAGVEYYVRIRPDLLATHGAPTDPWGGVLVAVTKPDSTSKKVQRIEAKEQRAALLATMTDEQKLAFVKQEREKRTAEKEAAARQKKAQMMADLMKELEAQGYEVKAPTAKQ